jgi:hypothetical protein
MGENGWITPKLAIKKRRTSSVATARKRNAESTDSPLARPSSQSFVSTEKSKFNPFLTKARILSENDESNRRDSIGIGDTDSSNDSTKVNLLL